MAVEIMIKGKKTQRGKKMLKGTGWRLVATAGVKPLLFVATLLGTVNRGKGERFAIFSVPKQ